MGENLTMIVHDESRQPDLAVGNARVIREFRQRQGYVGGEFVGGHLLLLHTAGARTGRTHLTPLGYITGEGRYYVMDGTSFYGATKKADWYHNLLANRHVTIEVGADRVTAIARPLAGAERREIWARFMPTLPEWIARKVTPTDHECPVVELTPTMP
jgi:deazaflavin-dependent oxidoreductase (nitroreductase family)